MGIVSSTFLSLAIELAWNFQRYLDPRYRYVEPKKSNEESSVPSSMEMSSTHSEQTEAVTGQMATEGTSTYQDNRNRRAAQLRNRRKRPSSFDATLIIKSMNKNGINLSTGHRVVSSTPSTLKRQQAPCWNASSSSSSTSSSSISSSEDSDMDVRAENTEQRLERRASQSEEHEEKDRAQVSGEEFKMSAAEEAAFRITLGRGHFTKSKKDRFLNHLRLEKRMNHLNQEFFQLACRAHARSLHRHHSGELRRII